MMQNPENKTYFVKRQTVYVVGHPAGVAPYQPEERQAKTPAGVPGWCWCHHRGKPKQIKGVLTKGVSEIRLSPLNNDQTMGYL